MSYYRINISDKRAVFQMAKPAISGKKVYFDPFAGTCEIKHSVKASKTSSIKFPESTFKPRNILWFLNKLGFKLIYDSDKKNVEIKLPKDTEARENLFSAYAHFYEHEVNFMRLDSLFYEGATSIYLQPFSIHHGLLENPTIIDVPNVVDGLILPEVEN